MSIQEILVTTKERPDPQGMATKEELKEVLGIPGISDVTTTTIYKLEGVSQQEAGTLQTHALTDPILEDSTRCALHGNEGTIQIEVAKKPGVMDPREESMRRVAKFYDVHPTAVATSTVYTIQGDFTDYDLDAVRKYLPSQLEEV